MNIAIVGTGYVGLVTGTCFAEMGTNVTCVDIDTEKIDKLNNGIMPIYEPGLEELVKKNVREGRLHFTTDLTSVLGKVEIVFSAVGTPPDEDGSADLHYVLDVARTFGHKINRYTLLVTKSTVPVGTAQKVKAAIREELEKRGVNIPFDVASNPEFLKEGAAIKDFMNPDRVVVGVDSQQARTLMERLYKPFLLNGFPIVRRSVFIIAVHTHLCNIPNYLGRHKADLQFSGVRLSCLINLFNCHFHFPCHSSHVLSAPITVIQYGLFPLKHVPKLFLCPSCQAAHV